MAAKGKNDKEWQELPPSSDGTLALFLVDLGDKAKHVGLR